MSRFSLCLKKKPQSQFKLFLFHHAGGNVSAYHSWFDAFGDSVEVTIVELPGRGRSFNQPLLSNYSEAVNFLSEEVFEQLDGRPFAVFGHSMGGLLSMGVVKELEKRGHRPHMVFVSGAVSPKCQLERPKNELSKLSLEDLVPTLVAMGGLDARVAQNWEMLEIFMPVFKADFTICETFNPHFNIKVNAPLRALGGDLDHGQGNIQNWGLETAASFKMKKFAGSHFYLNEEKDSLCQYIMNELSEECA